ncbi:hypothetical protein [Candidatus Methylomirabilis sp.]|uniref:hypothetical protein n=1 Tax=Candidatus Methylomirabilis sp. TaxID=2032687 RepID=UPI0030764A1F
MNFLVRTPDEVLAAIQKPELQTVKAFTLYSEDCLVVCAGFEERALAVLKSAVLKGSPCHVVLILYEPFIPENKADDIRRICQAAHLPIAELTYNRQEPAGFGSVLIDSLSAYRGRIFIDISGMSRLLIVQTLVALRRRPEGFANCFVAYVEAQHYPPSEKEAKAKLAKSESDPTFSIFFLSSGVFGVTLVPELSSYAPAGVQTRLITFPALDEHLLTALRAELQPSRYTFIEGVPPGSHNQWRQKAIAQVNHLDQIQNTERHQISTLDYRETLACLQTLYAKHGVTERLLISPTGSKMQAVAVGIFRSFVEDIQIVYPTPRGFQMPEKYTEGIGEMHLLPLGPLSII